MRYGPCIRCGRTIDWEQDLCDRCERIMALEEELGEEIKDEEIEEEIDE